MLGAQRGVADDPAGGDEVGGAQPGQLGGRGEICAGHHAVCDGGEVVGQQRPGIRYGRVQLRYQTDSACRDMVEYQEAEHVAVRRAGGLVGGEEVAEVLHQAGEAVGADRAPRQADLADEHRGRRLGQQLARVGTGGARAAEPEAGHHTEIAAARAGVRPPQLPVGISRLAGGDHGAGRPAASTTTTSMA